MPNREIDEAGQILRRLDDIYAIDDDYLPTIVVTVPRRSTPAGRTQGALYECQRGCAVRVPWSD